MLKSSFVSNSECSWSSEEWHQQSYASWSATSLEVTVWFLYLNSLYRVLRERWRAEWGGEREGEIFKNGRLLFYTTCVSGGAVGVLRVLPHQLPSFTPVCQELSISLTCIQLEGRVKNKWNETRCFLPFYWCGFVKGTCEISLIGWHHLWACNGPRPPRPALLFSSLFSGNSCKNQIFWNMSSPSGHRRCRWGFSFSHV